MARAYRLTLEPEDIETREVYYIEGDEYDDDPEPSGENDEFDAILCDNDGYYIDNVERVSLEEARKHHPYEV